MKKLWLFALLFVSVGSISVLWASRVQAPPKDAYVIFGPTGATLLKWCSDVGRLKAGDVATTELSIDVAKNAGSCSGYIAGVNDGAAGYAIPNPKNRRYCLPPQVEMDQLIRVVKKSLEDNPPQLHLPSSVLVIRALRDAFPCK